MPTSGQRQFPCQAIQALPVPRKGSVRPLFLAPVLKRTWGRVPRCCLLLLCILAPSSLPAAWDAEELSILRLHWIGSLPPLPVDPGNSVADDPRAAALGRRLFFDRRLSGDGEVACASCHVPSKGFTDGLARSRGVGETARNAPTLIGVAFSPWYFWDGRSDSLWSQALVPLEAALEHGGSRLQYAKLLHRDTFYRRAYENLFGPLPDLSDGQRFPDGAAPAGGASASAKWSQMAAEDRDAVTRVFVNIGKSLAAYERKLIPGPSRFDRYVEQVLRGDPDGGGRLSKDEIAGLKLFIGKGMCVTCHSGPLFTNHGFHNVGTPDSAMIKPDHRLPLMHLFVDKAPPDLGRYQGVREALASAFNCVGEYSDAAEGDCAELVFANKRHQDTLGAFKVPTLRNVSRTGPYMHAGQFQRLSDVLRHYNAPPSAPVGRSELMPLGMTEAELGQLEAFLACLESPVGVADEWPQLTQD